MRSSSHKPAITMIVTSRCICTAGLSPTRVCNQSRTVAKTMAASHFRPPMQELHILRDLAVIFAGSLLVSSLADDRRPFHFLPSLPSRRSHDSRIKALRPRPAARRSEEHTSELQSQSNLVCRLLLEKKKIDSTRIYPTRQCLIRDTEPHTTALQ